MESNNKLSKIIFKGSLIYSLRQVLVTVISLVTTLALTRMLQPSDFGYISFVTIILSSITLLSDGGLGVYLIQKKENISNIDISLITNIQLGLWLIFQFLILILYFFLINFTERDPNGVLYLLVASLSVPFAIFKAGSIINLERSLSFKKIAIIEILEQFVFTLIAIGLTFFKFGVWSIVLANICKVLTSYFLAKNFSPWKYSFTIYSKTKQEIFHFLKKGLAYQIPAILETVRAALNPLFIGVIFGMKYAGFTDRAILIASLPTSFLGTVFQKILFPLVARLQSEKQTLKSIFDKAIYLHSIFDKAFYLPFFLYGKEIITYFIGEKWVPILPVVFIFALGNIIFSAYTTTSIAFLKGLGLPKVLAYWSFIQLPLAIVSVYFCVIFFGFTGYAIGAQFLWIGVIFFHWQMKKYINLNVLRSIFVPLIAFVTSFLFMKFIFVIFYKYNHFILSSLFSLLFYFIVLFLMDKQRIINSIFYFKKSV